MNRAGHYIFALWFLLSSIFLSFFPRLISAVADWIYTILPHMVFGAPQLISTGFASWQRYCTAL